MADATAIPDASRPVWHNAAVAGMGLTSFFSDAGHEKASAILPLFLASIGAPPAALGAIEGVSDVVSSFAKLGGGLDRQPIFAPEARRGQWKCSSIVVGLLWTAANPAAGFAYAMLWSVAGAVVVFRVR